MRSPSDIMYIVQIYHSIHDTIIKELKRPKLASKYTMSCKMAEVMRQVVQQGEIIQQQRRESKELRKKLCKRQEEVICHQKEIIALKDLQTTVTSSVGQVHM